MAMTRRIAIASEYQQTREQRIKLNHERFQKLGIADLSLQLKPKRTPKPATHRITPSLDPTQPRRRSSRQRNPPPASKRSRDIELEEGAKPEFYTEEHDGLAVKKNSVKMGMPTRDPNKPKRPPSAFFVFLEDFRVQYKQKHPDNKSVTAVVKAAGVKWRSMSDAEKAPYVEEVEKSKADYEKNMSAYKKKNAEGPQDEQEDESDKSSSEVNDEDDDDDSGKFAKAGGEKLKSMSDAEKAPCIQKVEKRKADCEKITSACKKGLAEDYGGHHYQLHGCLPIPPPFLETNTAALEYEQTREQRIKQKRERFKKLGIVVLALQLKPRRTPKPSNHRITPSLGPTQPRRQSFRLQNPPPVSKRSRDIELEEGAKHDGFAEDPDKPKKPASAFFVFMEDFRVQYKQKHPDNKSVAAVGKAGGEKWKSMSDAEKAPYVEEAEKRRADYEKIMSAYKEKLELVANAQMVVERGEPGIPLDQPVTELCFELGGHQDGAQVSIQVQTSQHGMPSISADSAIDRGTAEMVRPVRESETSGRLQSGPPVSSVKPKEDRAKRSRDITLEEGAKPEFYTEKDNKLLGNTKISSTFSMDGLAVKRGSAKKGKPAKHPKKPKRPLSPYFVFLEDFRVQYKQKHPDIKSLAAFGKAAGEQWNSMSDAEKAPCVEEAEKRKADYKKKLSAYKKRLAEDESDKSGSEVDDEDDNNDSGEEDENDD